MDLRSGCLYWPRVNPAPPARGPLDHDIACDVAVIGAGISGALIGYHLTSVGMNVAILDCHDVAISSTAASTGLLQYEIDTPLVELANLVGRKAAERSYQLGLESFKHFEQLIRALGDDCGYRKRRSLFLAKDSSDTLLLRAECDARRWCGIDVTFLDQKQIKDGFGFNRPSGLLSRDAAEIDPYRFTIKLIEVAEMRGARVFPHTEVTAYDSDDKGVTLSTKNGRLVRAGRVVFATGYETPRFLNLEPELVRLKSTFALITRPISDWSHPAWPGKCLVWESATPYFYARPAHGRIMAGGEDEDFSDPERRDALIEAKCRTIESKIRSLFPSLDIYAECAWAGTFAETNDGLPYIGVHPKFPRGLFALGYGGNGITFSLIAARILCDHLAGIDTPDFHLFRFDR